MVAVPPSGAVGSAEPGYGVKLHQREVVARRPRHDPPEQHAETRRKPQRAGAPDAVGGGHDEPAVAVDDKAGAEHVVIADPRAHADHAEVEPRPADGAADSAASPHPSAATAPKPSAAAAQSLAPIRSIAAILCRVGAPNKVWSGWGLSNF